MLKHAEYTAARELLLSLTEPVGTEAVALPESPGRILAHTLRAGADVPPFHRSAYDGYAVRCADLFGAWEEGPVTLPIQEEVPAGHLAREALGPGAAVKILTGGPVPEGADAVIPFEKTRFTKDTVSFFAPQKPGDGIVFRGEDVRRGTVLAQKGTPIDAGLAGTLAGQGIAYPVVYRRPRIGILSTGDELVDFSQPLAPGKIYNTNLYTLWAALQAAGCDAVELGTAGDRTEDIAHLLRKGLEDCDGVICTGGVSVGDYDVTPAAMEAVGARMLVRGLNIKPGMAAAFSIKEGKLLLGLSGNPASAVTAFYAVVLPVLRKLAGSSAYLPREVPVTLLEGFRKPSPKTRLLRGRLVLDKGVVGMMPEKGQGNAVLSSAIGNDVLAVIPAGSGPLEAGVQLKGIIL